MQAVIFYWILIVGAARNKNQWKLGKPSSTQPQQKINPWNILQPILYLKFNSSTPEKLPSKKEKKACLPTSSFSGAFACSLNFGVVYSASHLPHTLRTWGGCLLGHFLRPYQGKNFLGWVCLSHVTGEFFPKKKVLWEGFFFFAPGWYIPFPIFFT